MAIKKFTVSVEQLSQRETGASQPMYRITKISGPGVSFQKGSSPMDADKRFHVEEVLSEEQANTLGPLITLHVTKANTLGSR